MDPGDEATERRGGQLAIFHPPGRLALTHNPFGKDVANLQFWRALARHGGYSRIDFLGQQPAEPAAVAADLFEGAPPTSEIRTGLVTSSSAPAAAGALLRGQPELHDLAWMRRRRGGDRAFSLIGLIHTIAPPTMRRTIAATALAPMHPWDALICTSPAVRDALGVMFAGWGEHLAARTGGHPPPHPTLAVLPLGVDAGAVAALADRPDARARVRAELGLAEDDVLVLWVGRLSYYEKAFPQPMFKAVRQARDATGAKVALVMAGWFPAEADRGLYEEAARAHAPGVDVRLVDGNDHERLGELWAAADIFLSLVDNIQETFGITPLEAMAAGLPIVASDWDGYRFTVRHGVEGFLVPTLLGPAGGGTGATLVERHELEGLSYQAYVGVVAQHTAVHIARAAEALAELIRAPELRRRMGAAGRARVREFDWALIVGQFRDLVDELSALRAASPDPTARPPSDPVAGDPYRDFTVFATDPLTLDTVLTAAPGVSPEAVRACADVALDVAFPRVRAPPELCAEAFALIAERGGASVRDVLVAFPTPKRRGLELGLAWMAKYGFVDWLT